MYVYIYIRLTMYRTIDEQTIYELLMNYLFLIKIQFFRFESDQLMSKSFWRVKSDPSKPPTESHVLTVMKRSLQTFSCGLVQVPFKEKSSASRKDRLKNRFHYAGYNFVWTSTLFFLITFIFQNLYCVTEKVKLYTSTPMTPRSHSTRSRIGPIVSGIVRGHTGIHSFPKSFILIPLS